MRLILWACLALALAVSIAWGSDDLLDSHRARKTSALHRRLAAVDYDSWPNHTPTHPPDHHKHPHPHPHPPPIGNPPPSGGPPPIVVPPPKHDPPPPPKKPPPPPAQPPPKKPPPPPVQPPPKKPPPPPVQPPPKKPPPPPAHPPKPHPPPEHPPHWPPYSPPHSPPVWSPPGNNNDACANKNLIGLLLNINILNCDQINILSNTVNTRSVDDEMDWMEAIQRDESFNVMRRDMNMAPTSSRSLCESSVTDELVSRGVLSCERGTTTLYASNTPLSARACQNAHVGFVSELGLVNCRKSLEQGQRRQDVAQLDEQYAKLYLRALEIREETQGGDDNTSVVRSFIERQDVDDEGALESRDCSPKTVRGLMAISAGQCGVA